MLPGHACIPAGFDHVVDGAAGLLTIVLAVQEHHIGALGTHGCDAGEVFTDKVMRIEDIFREYPAEFIGPGMTFVRVGADEGMHGEHVHVIVMAAEALPFQAVPKERAVYNMIASDQSGQIEGLAWGVDSDGAHFCILADTLGGDMFMAFQDDVGPDLVGDNHHIIFPEDLHGFFDLPPFPHTAAGIVRTAEDGEMNMVFFDPALHVFVVHTPDSVFILHKGTQLGSPSVILQHMGEADVSGAVQQEFFTGSRESLHGGGHTAQHSVLVADVLPGQPFHAVSKPVPADDGIIIFLFR